MSDGKVIFLKFKPKQFDEDAMTFISCKVCRNKTFTHTIDRPEGFPVARCAACGNHLGRVGYADDDDPVLQT